MKKNKFILKFKKFAGEYKFFFKIFLLLLVAVPIAYAATSFYRVNVSAPSGVAEWGVCKHINNSGGKDIFIPTQTSPEWQSFYNNPPVGVTVSACACESQACSAKYTNSSDASASENTDIQTDGQARTLVAADTGTKCECACNSGYYKNGSVCSPLCGNGTCGAGEDCTNCSADCYCNCTSGSSVGGLCGGCGFNSPTYGTNGNTYAGSCGGGCYGGSSQFYCNKGDWELQEGYTCCTPCSAPQYWDGSACVSCVLPQYYDWDISACAATCLGASCGEVHGGGCDLWNRPACNVSSTCGHTWICANGSWDRYDQ